MSGILDGASILVRGFSWRGDLFAGRLGAGLVRVVSLGVAAFLTCAAYGLCQSVASPGGSHPGEGHGDVSSQTSVVETQWNLTELNGSAVNLPANESQPYIYLQAEGYKLSGTDGCNRFFGSYDLSGSSLQFHSVAQTLMACKGGFTEREAEFLEALKTVTSFQISENVLVLKADDRVLGRFQARKK